MGLSTSQLPILRAAIDTDPVLSAFPQTPDGAVALAAVMNATANPDYFVWRTAITEVEITDISSPDGTDWNWVTYKNQGVAERDTWSRMFNRQSVNPSRVNVRNFVASVFSGTGAANVQAAHILSCFRRKATLSQKIFATATLNGIGQRGSAANPDTMTVEAPLTGGDVEAARELVLP